MKPSISLTGLVWCVGVAVQFAVPAWMIARQEWILRHGTRVCFEAAVVDPRDPFRGRYVEIGLAEFDRRNIPHSDTRKHHAIVETNELGVARLARLEPPLPGREGLYVNVWSQGWGGYLQNPFNRFYMPEKLAPVAEKIYNEAMRDNGTNTVLLAVRLHNGRGVVEDLLVNGTPMIEAARKRLKKK